VLNVASRWLVPVALAVSVAGCDTCPEDKLTRATSLAERALADLDAGDFEDFDELFGGSADRFAFDELRSTAQARAGRFVAIHSSARVEADRFVFECEFEDAPVRATLTIDGESVRGLQLVL
jgi:hypothetical protein